MIQLKLLEMLIWYAFLSIHGIDPVKVSIKIKQLLISFDYSTELNQSITCSLYISFANTAKKWSYLLRISSVNVNQSTVSCGFGPIYWKKHQFLCSGNYSPIYLSAYRSTYRFLSMMDAIFALLTQLSLT